jgi:hypothetical protein
MDSIIEIKIIHLVVIFCILVGLLLLFIKTFNEKKIIKNNLSKIEEEKFNLEKSYSILLSKEINIKIETLNEVLCSDITFPFLDDNCSNDLVVINKIFDFILKQCSVCLGVNSDDIEFKNKLSVICKGFIKENIIKSFDYNDFSNKVHKKNKVLLL